MKSKILMILSLMLVTLPLNISASSATVVGPRTMTVGGSGKLGLTNPVISEMSGTVTNSNPSVIQLVNTKNLVYRNGAFTMETDQSFEIKALAAGTATITFKGVGYELETDNSFQVSASITITVAPKAEPKPDPKPDPKPPVKDNTEEEKKGNTLSEEQKKKAEEERKKKELEAKKLIPLVKKAEITSESDKMKGKLLKTISFVNSEFDYEYTLPKNVNDVSINIPGVEGVSLDYEKNHSLAESDDQKVVSIKAKKGEIDQVLKIKLVKDTTPDITRNFESANASKSIQGLVVYHEPEVNKLLEGFGFKNLTEEIIGSYFSNDKMELQVLVDDSNTVNFYLLDNEKELETLVNPIVTSDDKLFFIDSSIREADEIFGHKKSEITVEELFTLSDIDSSLKVNENVLGWELEEGLIVEGFTDNGTDAKFQIAENNDITKVIVPKVAPEPTDYVKIGLAVALTALAATNIIYFAVGYARKRKYDY